MAQYYAEIQGNRGGASRMGSKASGMQGHIRGWNIGAKVWIAHNEKTGKDEVTVYRTSGSNGASAQEVVAEFTE